MPEISSEEIEISWRHMRLGGGGGFVGRHLQRSVQQKVPTVVEGNPLVINKLEG